MKNVRESERSTLDPNLSITMGIDQQAVSEEKQAAQHLAFSDLESEEVQSNPPAPNEEG
jgi:hypothetical protein